MKKKTCVIIFALRGTCKGKKKKNSLNVHTKCYSWSIQVSCHFKSFASITTHVRIIKYSLKKTIAQLRLIYKINF